MYIFSRVTIFQKISKLKSKFVISIILFIPLEKTTETQKRTFPSPSDQNKWNFLTPVPQQHGTRHYRSQHDKSTDKAFHVDRYFNRHGFAERWVYLVASAYIARLKWLKYALVPAWWRTGGLAIGKQVGRGDRYRGKIGKEKKKRNR